jgi:flagellar protein FlaG
LAISIDDELGSTIIKVTDRETDEVIRQIPPERIVNLARFMRESSSEGGFELAETMKGLLLESKG